jgi:hypothetical protein
VLLLLPADFVVSVYCCYFSISAAAAAALAAVVVVFAADIIIDAALLPRSTLSMHSCNFRMMFALNRHSAPSYSWPFALHFIPPFALKCVLDRRSWQLCRRVSDCSR